MRKAILSFTLIFYALTSSAQNKALFVLDSLATESKLQYSYVYHFEKVQNGYSIDSTGNTFPVVQTFKTLSIFSDEEKAFNSSTYWDEFASFITHITDFSDDYLLPIIRTKEFKEFYFFITKFYFQEEDPFEGTKTVTQVKGVTKNAYVKQEIFMYKL